MSQFSLYKWRYYIGYFALLAVAISTLIFAGFLVPGGLREAEHGTALVSGSLNAMQFDPESVVNLPYHVMQRALFAVFGISMLTIKLPSILLGLATLVGVFFLIKNWFRTNVAVITTTIVATLPAFLFIAQDGTPTMYAIAVSIWLLLAATHVSRKHSPVLVWRLLAFILLALNLYAPLGIYLNIAIVSTIVFHPHTRHVTRRLSLNHVASAVLLALLLLTPLIYSISTNLSVGLTLLGIPESMPAFYDNSKTLALTYFGFYSSGSGPIAQPMFSIGAFLVLAIGAYRFLQIKYTARSYITWFWILTLIPFIFINPEYSSYILPLSFLMIAMGMASLIADWYKLFPFNPYARVAGLFPLSLIVAGLVISGAGRYTMSYYYSPDISAHFDSDLRLLSETLSDQEATEEDPAIVLPPSQHQAFYELVEQYDKRFVVKEAVPKSAKLLIVSGRNDLRSTITLEPERIITSRKSNQSDRFYLYTDDPS